MSMTTFLMARLHVIKNAVTIVQQRLRGDDSEVHQYLEMAKRNTDRGASSQRILLSPRAFVKSIPV